ncbi:unnamed protein product, partial [Amoebophrya sp. A120]
DKAWEVEGLGPRRADGEGTESSDLPARHTTQLAFIPLGDDFEENPDARMIRNVIVAPGDTIEYPRPQSASEHAMANADGNMKVKNKSDKIEKGSSTRPRTVAADSRPPVAPPVIYTASFRHEPDKIYTRLPYWWAPTMVPYDYSLEVSENWNFIQDYRTASTTLAAGDAQMDLTSDAEGEDSRSATTALQTGGTTRTRTMRSGDVAWSDTEVAAEGSCGDEAPSASGGMNREEDVENPLSESDQQEQAKYGRKHSDASTGSSVVTGSTATATPRGAGSSSSSRFLSMESGGGTMSGNELEENSSALEEDVAMTQGQAGHVHDLVLSIENRSVDEQVAKRTTEGQRTGKDHEHSDTTTAQAAEQDEFGTTSTMRSHDPLRGGGYCTASGGPGSTRTTKESVSPPQSRSGGVSTPAAWSATSTLAISSSSSSSAARGGGTPSSSFDDGAVTTKMSTGKAENFSDAGITTPVQPAVAQTKTNLLKNKVGVNLHAVYVDDTTGILYIY